MPHKPLNNNYFLMRHGRSAANEEGIIISDPANGCEAYGLSPAGREQITESLEATQNMDSDTLIYCSDFLRTRETAALVSQILDTAAPQRSALLRERNFGTYEKSPDANYQKVWDKDVLDGNNKDMGVESPEEVRERFLSFITEMENKYKGKNILIVSHGDILQIAQTWPEDVPPKDHRSLIHLETAEIRSFNPKN